MDLKLDLWESLFITQLWSLMKTAKIYFHLNGLEYLKVHKPLLLKEVQQIIRSIDAEKCRTKISRGRKIKGKNLYSPITVNTAFKNEFLSFGWTDLRYNFYVTHEESVLREISSLSPEEQKKQIEKKGLHAIRSYNQTDFIKEHIAVKVQFGKYPFVAYDLFVKHVHFFVSNKIDVGIEVLPMKEMQSLMSSVISYYERELMNIIRQRRSSPYVPLVIFGIEP